MRALTHKKITKLTELKVLMPGYQLWKDATTSVHTVLYLMLDD